VSAPEALGVPERRPAAEIAAARQRHMEWLQRFGLVRSRSSLAQYDTWRIAEMSAYIYPAASGSDLDVVVDTMGWFVLLDDQYDGTHRFRAAELGQLRDELLERLAGGLTRPSRIPLVQAWADLCPRVLDGMSPAWRRRAVDSWREMLDACIAEGDLTAEGPDPVETYLTVRRAAVMGNYGTVLLERVARCELPESVVEDPHIAQVRRCMADVALLLNDMYSLHRELARGDEINLAVILQKAYGYTVEQALEELRGRERNAMALLRAQSRAFLDAHRTAPLPPAHRAAVERFLAGVDAITAGLRVWYPMTDRYASPENASDRETIDDIFTPW
jgi:hypothetical protein